MTRVDYDPEALARFARRPATRSLLLKTAAEVKKEAQRLAPSGTGDYRESLRVKVSENGAVVYTDDPAGHMVEFGSINNPAYAVLRRACRKVGLKFREIRR